MMFFLKTYSEYFNVHKTVFRNSSFSHDKVTKFDTSLVVQKTYLRAKHIESDIEEDIDMKNQIRINSLTCPVKNTDARCKSSVYSGKIDPSIIKNKDHVDFKDKTLVKNRFVELKSLHAVSQHLTPGQNIDDATNEITLVRTYLKNYFDINSLINISRIFLNFEPTNFNHAATRSYVENAIDQTTLVRNKNVKKF